MIKSNYVAEQNKYLDSGSKYKNISSAKTFVNCVISGDTPRKLDFLILVIETLQINASDSLLLKAKDIGLPDQYSSRVEFWKMRCSNPLRNTYSFTSLSSEQIDSIIELISCMAENLYPLIRQLLSSKESQTLNKERWDLFSSRLKSLIRERMNIQRSFISTLLSEDNNEFFRHLLVILSLSCGKAGANRLKASLYYQS
ncbi:DUF3038 domain-containing protein [Prochlorococcus marinus]|uniref:DUF3038 domain-containing protein n=1 Tax=Prochlorococcus marinus TaxID=1219 RepID=UPI0022B2ACB6|nr:DUF3038 domain-containing protein [Prochlorococcus marinus]